MGGAQAQKSGPQAAGPARPQGRGRGIVMGQVLPPEQTAGLNACVRDSLANVGVHEITPCCPPRPEEPFSLPEDSPNPLNFDQVSEASAKVSGTQRRTMQYCINFARKPDEPVGMDLDFLDRSTLNICKVSDGAVLKWNRKALRDFRVTMGDRINEVNGIRGDALLLIARIAAGGDLEMWLTRPMQVKVPIPDASSSSLGLDLDYVANGVSLRIYGMDPGPILAWNRREPTQAIGINDRVIQVNECKGLAMLLMTEIRKRPVLNITFLRYAD
eukprot:NODE_1754_length_1069_cov_139.393491.p1 GENE.NODE_1754_length_1069_cov_139.393491~~NODE_1754_length_1069_cov_139.393491.p1  ORF type:complete len:272 (+),score=51.53 NODE_1754_length_1069_cov_139.393491:3-818(+)